MPSPSNMVSSSKGSIPLYVLNVETFAVWKKRQQLSVRVWLDSNKYQAKAGEAIMVPNQDGRPEMAIYGVPPSPEFWDFSRLTEVLPVGTYHLEEIGDIDLANSVALGWALGGYAFSKYLKAKAKARARLVWPYQCDRIAVCRTYAAVSLARDLINTPASDMGPSELASVTRRVARAYEATCRVIVGDDLLRQNYPMIHAVGRSSVRAPRLIDLRWGSMRHPKVTLVGKGVCFDSGGLDLKSSSGMSLMKKDMGGAAAALGLAQMIMEAKVKVRLRLLIPAVENSVSGNSFRPGDVLQSRKGLSVEIGNTDAEGRLILADALAEADSEKPELLFDFATLTGAARIALGPELANLFTNDEALSQDLSRLGIEVCDPVWRMPLWESYKRMIKGKIADLNNSGENAMAGAITAALFLEHFVEKAGSWAHFDIYGWNRRSQPGRPEGGEAQAMRVVYALLCERYPTP